MGKRAVMLLLPVLAGCEDVLGGSSARIEPERCFSITSANGNQPHSAILLDGCTGKSWLLVESDMTKNPEDGFTYHWMALDRYDTQSPVLIRKN